MLGVALLVTAIGTKATGRPDELPLLRVGWAQLVLAAAVAALFAVVLTVAERRNSRVVSSGWADRVEPHAPRCRAGTYEPAGRLSPSRRRSPSSEKASPTKSPVLRRGLRTGPRRW